MTMLLVRTNPDRRNQRAREILLQRIRGEFEEMPGMCLTRPQAARLFGLTPAVCDRIFAELVRESVLYRAADDLYRLHEGAARPGPRARANHLTPARPKAS